MISQQELADALLAYQSALQKTNDVTARLRALKKGPGTEAARLKLRSEHDQAVKDQCIAKARFKVLRGYDGGPHPRTLWRQFFCAALTKTGDVAKASSLADASLEAESKRWPGR